MTSWRETTSKRTTRSPDFQTGSSQKPDDGKETIHIDTMAVVNTVIKSAIGGAATAFLLNNDKGGKR